MPAAQGPTVAQTQHALGEFHKIDIGTAKGRGTVDGIHEALSPKNKRILKLIVQKWPNDSLAILFNQ
jgi:hypothetical protein